MTGSRMIVRGIAWACLVAAVTAVAGCGSHRGRGGTAVSGTVTLDGEPMSAGSIVFVPLDHGHKAAGEITDGRFHIPAAEGPVPGRYRIEIYAPIDASVPLDDPIALARAGPRAVAPNRVAPQFNSASTLTAEVRPDGNNEFSFDVTSIKR